MTKMPKINYLLPLNDYLYIYQNFEYQFGDFIKWWFKQPLRRNLQQKHALDWTTKMRLLAITSHSLIIFKSIILGQILFNSWWFGLVLIPLIQQFSPLFIGVATIMISPLDYYQKRQILKAAVQKRRRLSQLKVIAIDGSFAKTSIKEMLYTLLWKDFQVVKTPKSYNTLVSIARSFLTDVKPTTEVFIAEMDAYHPGEIRALANLVKPNLGLITNIAPQHLERFGSMDKLAKAQFEIAESLTKEGQLFLNADDQLSQQLAPNYDIAKTFIGQSPQADIQYRNLELTKQGTKGQIKFKSGDWQTVTLPLYGEHHFANYAAAAALAKAVGLPVSKIIARSQLFQPTPHRMEVSHQNGVTIIDNSYNANPISSQSAMKLLQQFDGSRKWLMTPGLVELGDQFQAQNTNLGELAALSADQIILVGQNAKQPIMHGLKLQQFPDQQLHLVDSTKAGFELFWSQAQAGDVLLIENDLPDQYS